MACFIRIFAVIMETVFISLMLISVEPGTAAKVTPGPCGFTPEIEAEQGDNVTLQCCFDPQINLKNRTVDLKRDGKVIHAYRHEKDFLQPQIKEYTNRTTLNHGDLTRGIMTLQIFSVKLSDSGEYECNVPKHPILTPKVVKLTVRERQQPTVRLDSSTRSPVGGETNPNISDAEKKDVGAIVGGVCGAVGALVFLVVVVLVKHGNIQEYWRRLKRGTQQDVKTNGLQLENLMNQSRDDEGDLNGAAGNDQGDNDQVV